MDPEARTLVGTCALATIASLSTLRCMEAPGLLPQVESVFRRRNSCWIRRRVTQTSSLLRLRALEASCSRLILRFPKSSIEVNCAMTGSATLLKSQPVSERDLLLPVHTESFPSYDNFNKTLEISEVIIETPDEDSVTCGFSFRTLWAYAGPGWLMSIAYVDPGNLESDLQAGAYAGYQLIWMLFGATLMGYYLQVLAARLGVVTGKNLAEMCKAVYPRWVSYTLWIMAEIAIVGSDIQVVLGSSIAFQILFGFPLWLGCLFTAIDTFTFLLLHRYGVRKLEAFFVSLIAIMLVCFCVNLVRGDVSPADVASGFVPQVESYAVTQAVGIVGAVIMPHNIFLHSALVQTRQVNRYDSRKVREANKYFAIESGIALFVSFLINVAVLAVFAKGFFSMDCSATYAVNGLNTACVPGAIADGETYGSCQLANGGDGLCQTVGLSQAGEALSGMLGQYADTIWAIGLLAAGQSSTMTGTYAGQFVMEGFINLRIPQWKRVALTRGMALLPAVGVAVLSQQNPADSDRMDELLNVLQSIQLPFALLPVLIFTSSPVIMGSFANTKTTVVSGWVLGGLVCIINLYLIFETLDVTAMGATGQTALVSTCCLYFGFLVYLMRVDPATPEQRTPPIPTTRHSSRAVPCVRRDTWRLSEM